MDEPNYEHPARSYKKLLRLLSGMRHRKAQKMGVPTYEQPAPAHKKSLRVLLGMVQRKSPKTDVPNYEQPASSHEKSLGLDLGVRERNQLCSSCSKIDFKSIFALSSKKVGRHGIALTETRTDIQSGCDLCSLVASMASLKVISTFRSFEIPEAGYHLRALDSLWPLMLLRNHARNTANLSIVIAVVQGRSSKTLERDQLNEAIRRGVIVPVAEHSPLETSKTGPYFYGARTVSCTKVDFARIGSWLRECQESKSESHHYCKSQSGRTVFFTRVIDCETREILPLTPDLEYLALSYVWGSNAIDTEVDQTIQSDLRLPHPAPRTIEDAINVVRSLQKRYLWVDRYCIWHSEDKHLQIQNMDQIYRNAWTTIVAVDGENAESGLMGMSCPRHQQASFRTNAGTLAHTFPHVSYHLSTSKWVTRGWTYQEAVLSRSCLFFTKDQVYFACKMHLRSEAVEQKQIVDNGPNQEVLAPKLMKLSEADTLPTTGNSLFFFHDHMREYTSRSLSWDSDALNAFKGIIASLDVYTYWGVPLTNTTSRTHVSIDKSQAVFAQNLAWVGKRVPPGGRAIRRRKSFPTWSWTSLVDQIETKNKDDQNSVFLECSAFYVEDDTQNRLRLTDVLWNAQKEGTLIVPEYGRALLVEAMVTQVFLRSTETEGVYSLHFSQTHPGDQTSPYPGLKLLGEALVDCTDADFLSGIEPRPWSAIKIFWIEDSWPWSSEPERHIESYWMLVDQCDSVARRIGLIRSSGYFKGEMTMDSLKAERRCTRIE
jgi:hypothetical protein